MGKEQVIDYVMNSPANTNKAVLEGMLDGMGGANVPTPTVEDAGKVLGVNESGSYALTEASKGGGGEPLIVTFTWNEDAERYYADKTYGEVKSAFMERRFVIFKVEHSTNTVSGISENYDEEHKQYTGYAFFGDRLSVQTGQKPSYEEMLNAYLEE